MTVEKSRVKAFQVLHQHAQYCAAFRKQQEAIDRTPQMQNGWHFRLQTANQNHLHSWFFGYLKPPWRAITAKMK